MFKPCVCAPATHRRQPHPWLHVSGRSTEGLVVSPQNRHTCGLDVYRTPTDAVIRETSSTTPSLEKEGPSSLPSILIQAPEPAGQFIPENTVDIREGLAWNSSMVSTNKIGRVMGF